MCGIVGITSTHNISNILIECLKRLEYRGYDSAGLALIDAAQTLRWLRVVGKIKNLESAFNKNPLPGNIGIAHTRWATHGAPIEKNAHPHISKNTLALAHNGIIENHQKLRAKLKLLGYKFYSDTDTEVIAHLAHYYYKQTRNLLEAISKTARELHGAFALAILCQTEPDKIVAVRCGSPIVIGLGSKENFVASDTIALLPLTKKFIYLEEGDIAELTANQVKIYDTKLHLVKRKIKTSTCKHNQSTLGNYRHFVEKEIFEQPLAIAETIAARISDNSVFVESFGNHAKKILNKINHLQIVACGSSYHVGLVGKYWLEELAGVSSKVEIASELRYRTAAVSPNTLLVTISQSGETADTLAALRQAKNLPYATNLAICNVPESSLVRGSDLIFMTRAGTEIGVATTKAFTAQLVALLLLTLALGKAKKTITKKKMAEIIQELKHLPTLVEEVLTLDKKIAELAKKLIKQKHMFFLGRGTGFPIALEGALKLKEISYIHAEAYPAGELKHGPLALIDRKMYTVVVAPDDGLLDKIKSNIAEIKARRGRLIIFAASNIEMHNDQQTTIIKLPKVSRLLAPIIYTIPLQLLAYHTAVLRGTNVDQPRNLAKSVTVE